MKKTLIIVLGILVILVISFYALNTYIHNQKQGEKVNASVEQKQEITYLPSDFEWKIEDIEGDYHPHQRLTLEVGGKEYILGDYQYNCDNRNGSQENQIAYKICWWGGAGAEFVVVHENGQYVLKERWVQETGNNEEVEPWGEWEVRYVIGQ